MAGIKGVRPTCGHHNGSWNSPDHEIGGGEDLRCKLCIAIDKDKVKHGDTLIGKDPGINHRSCML